MSSGDGRESYRKALATRLEEINAERRKAPGDRVVGAIRASWLICVGAFVVASCIAFGVEDLPFGVRIAVVAVGVLLAWFFSRSLGEMAAHEVISTHNRYRQEIERIQAAIDEVDARDREESSK